MPKHKKPGRKLSRHVFQLRADPAWLDDVALAANAVNMSTSEYVREATERQLVQDGIIDKCRKDPGKVHAHK